jgi:hypothetical protein
MWEWRYSSTILISALEGGERSTSCLRNITPEKEPPVPILHFRTEPTRDAMEKNLFLLEENELRFLDRPTRSLVIIIKMA